MTVSLKRQTPDEWLLERFDQDGHILRRLHTHAPPIVKILDDHRSVACDAIVGSDCRYWSGAASWPSPRSVNDISERRAA